jgi:hypothetical protein
MKKCFKLKITTMINLTIQSRLPLPKELITTFISSNLPHHLWNYHFLLHFAMNFSNFSTLRLDRSPSYQWRVDFSFFTLEFTNHSVVFSKLQSWFLQTHFLHISRAFISWDYRSLRIAAFCFVQITLSALIEAPQVFGRKLQALI